MKVLLKNVMLSVLMTMLVIPLVIASEGKECKITCTKACCQVKCDEKCTDADCGKCGILTTFSKIDQSFAKGDFDYPVDILVIGGSMYQGEGQPLLQFDSQEVLDGMKKQFSEKFKKIEAKNSNVKISLSPQGNSQLFANRHRLS